jgi:hypothetical protein
MAMVFSRLGKPNTAMPAEATTEVNFGERSILDDKGTNSSPQFGAPLEGVKA